MAAHSNSSPIAHPYGYAHIYPAHSHQYSHGSAPTTGQYSRMARDGDPLAFDDPLVTEHAATRLA